MKIEELEKEIKELKKKLEIVEDIENIKRLHYRYINSFIASKWERIVDCFAEDAVVDLGGLEEGRIIKGKEQITKLFKDGICRVTHIGREACFVVHPTIDVDGDKATGKFVSYFMNVRSMGRDPMLRWMQGVYACKYIKVDKEWKFSLFKWRPRLKYAEPQMEYIENDLI